MRRKYLRFIHMIVRSNFMARVMADNVAFLDPRLYRHDFRLIESIIIIRNPGYVVYNMQIIR
jgi:hypothetical protein